MLKLKNPEIIDYILNVTGINASRQELTDYIINYVKSSLSLPHSPFMIIVYIVYLCLFLCGACGNCWAMAIMIRRFKMLSKHSRGNRRNGVLLYTLGLSLSNLLVVLTLPMLICSISIKRWVFGPILCKTYYIVESGDKLLSVFLLTGLSCERYLSVCRWCVYGRFRDGNGSRLLLIALVAAVAILLAPVYVFAQQYYYDYPLVYNGNSGSAVSIAECSLNLDPQMYQAFTWYLFFFAFCLPSLLIVYFYLRILLFVYGHSRSVAANRCCSRLPLKRVTLLTLGLVAFHFSCWTPYWAGTIYGLVNGQQIEEQSSQLFFVLHTLVYVNSSLNWLFYAFMSGAGSFAKTFSTNAVADT